MKIYLDSVGCRLNQSEIELMANRFHRAGHQIVENSSQADIVIVNTCAVTAAAASDSRQKIRQAARNGHARIIPTGCWATIDPQSALQLPSVDRIVHNLQKESLIADLIGEDGSVQDEDLPRISLPGQHKRTRAFIKVQDGCDNLCSYCITRVARGKSRSRALESVLSDVQSSIDGGVKEIVLTGAQLGSWGRDLFPRSNLPGLIAHILEETTIGRLRLSSLEPWEITDDYLPIISNSRFCKHLHLPLQSGSQSVLKRMLRPITPEKYAQVVNKINQVDPDIAITTDLIIGFPGETEQEFADTLDIVRQMQFSGGHVFSFSPRPFTKAGTMAMPIPSLVKKQRSQVLRELIADSAAAFRASQIGKIRQVLWESSVKQDRFFLMEGLTDNYLRISILSERDLSNQFSSVSLVEGPAGILKGKIR
jgi:threonylcarbamoyladenosine tRNA methylthiotransferase MtaB